MNELFNILLGQIFQRIQWDGVLGKFGPVQHEDKHFLSRICISWANTQSTKWFGALSKCIQMEISLQSAKINDKKNISKSVSVIEYLCVRVYLCVKTAN